MPNARMVAVALIPLAIRRAREIDTSIDSSKKFFPLNWSSTNLLDNRWCMCKLQPVTKRPSTAVESINRFIFLPIVQLVMDINLENPVSITTDLEKKIADAFLIFDHQGNKTVDVREIGTILRYLGCVPSENEINEIITATEFEDSNGTIHLSRFLPHVTQLLAEHKMEAAAPEKLLEAFRVLDADGKGIISRDHVAKLMMEEGEPFTQEELDEMMATAVDVQSGDIPYEYYINSLMVDI